MSRVLITGSSDGLGLMAARLLVADGHSVTLHARNQARADDTKAALPQSDGVIVGDLSSIAGMRQVAGQANAAGRFDAVIHNAGIGYREVRRVETDDGLSQVFAVNVQAPYLLVAALAPAMAERGRGAIINIPTIVANIGINGMSVSATKRSHASFDS